MTEPKGSMTDKEIAEAYADNMRKLLIPVVEVMNQASGVNNMKIDFVVGWKDGRAVIADVSVTKTTKLV